MKRAALIATVLIVGVAAFGLISYANAQTPTPPTPQVPFGPGMRGGHMRPGGMWGMRGQNQAGPMHEYMEAALAEALDISVEELEAAHEAGKTAWELAEEQGLSAEQFQAAMLEARQKAMQKMVEAGLLTQEQADWMLNRMHNGRGGFGSQGGCPGMRGEFSGPGDRRGGSQQPAPANPPSTNF